MTPHTRPLLRHFGPGHTNGVHDFLMTELELGERVTMALENEACGFGPWFDMLFDWWVAISELCGLFALVPFTGEH